MARVRTGSPTGSPVLRVVPANESGFEAVRAVLGQRGPGARCQCQRYKLERGEAFATQPVEVRAERLRDQVCGDAAPGSTTSGLVGLVGDVPVAWCAVEPRRNYPGLVRNQKVPWAGRAEDKADGSVWAITCLLVRAGHRRRGYSGVLVEAAVAFARDHGARAVEAYPMTTSAALVDELHPGLLDTYLGAGFTEVTRPTTRRAVVRIDLA